MRTTNWFSACIVGTLPLWLRPVKSAKKAKPTNEMFPRLKPDFERLETRMLPTTVAFSASAYSVNENAAKYTVNVNLSQADPNHTITVQYATSDGSAAAGTDYTSTSGTLSFAPNATNQTFNVFVTDDDVNDSNKTVTLTLSNPTNATLGSPSTSTLTINLVNPTTTWAATTQQRVNDPFQATVVPFGIYGFAPTTGSLEVMQALDFNRHLPSRYDAWFNEGIPTPALVYWSDTTNVKPILEATLAQRSVDSTPTQIQAQLTWNGGTPQSWVTFSNFSGSSTAVYLMATQVASAVASTGVYSWSIKLDASFSDRGDVVRTVTGKAYVVVNDTTQGLGYGWSIASVDRLVADGSNGMMWVYGSGGSRYFSGAGPTYTSPANDFGTLVKNVDGTFTYTAVNQVKWNFSTSGQLTSIVDPHSLSESFSYSGNLLSTVTMPDGGVTTFTYSSNLLTKITEPGNRVVTVTIDGSNNLTSLTLPDGSLRTLTYDGNHRLTNEKFGPLNTTFAYDATNLTLTSIDRGGGTTETIAAQSVVGLSTNPGKLTTDAKAKLTDPNSIATTYTLDQQGRVTAINQAAGFGFGASGQSWTRNSAGQVTTYTDTLSNVTTYTYSGADLTETDFPETQIGLQLFSGGSWLYQYDPTYHTVTKFTDTLGNVSTYTYNASGDLATIKNALNQVTTFVWSSGLLQSITNPLSQTTTFQYDSTTRRLTDVVNALNGITTFGYDASGNILTSQDANGHTTTFTFDGLRRVLTQTNALNGTVTLTYNALGEVLTRTDELGRVTSFTYRSYAATKERNRTALSSMGLKNSSDLGEANDNTRQEQRREVFCRQACVQNQWGAGVFRPRGNSRASADGGAWLFLDLAVLQAHFAQPQEPAEGLVDFQGGGAVLCREDQSACPCSGGRSRASV
jgi:YD repeat-containing protein